MGGEEAHLKSVSRDEEELSDPQLDPRSNRAQWSPSATMVNEVTCDEAASSPSNELHQQVPIQPNMWSKVVLEITVHFLSCMCSDFMNFCFQTCALLLNLMRGPWIS